MGFIIFTDYSHEMFLSEMWASLHRGIHSATTASVYMHPEIASFQDDATHKNLTGWRSVLGVKETNFTTCIASQEDSCPAFKTCGVEQLPVTHVAMRVSLLCLFS